MNRPLSLVTTLMLLSWGFGYASAQQPLFDKPTSETGQNSSQFSQLPHVQMDGTTFDFGTVDEGEIVRHAFKVTNLGSGELQITRVTPGWGCTVAQFDRALPPGGEGEITLQVDLHNFQGIVQKSATVYTNDPQQPQFNLLMKAVVKPFIEVKPTNAILFRGFPEKLQRQTIDLIATSSPFHILKTDTNLAQQISIERETVEDGKHYRLRVANLASQGIYSGFILVLTDHPRRPEVKIIVTGAIESDLGVSPLALFIGSTGTGQPLRNGEIRVRHNRKQTFRISRLTYDDKLITVTQEPIDNGTGYLLKVAPRMENIPKGEHRETTITIETDSRGGTKDEVRVNVVNH